MVKSDANSRKIVQNTGRSIVKKYFSTYVKSKAVIHSGAATSIFKLKIEKNRKKPNKMVGQGRPLLRGSFLHNCFAKTIR